MLKKKKMTKKMVLSPQSQGNVTSMEALPKKNPLDKKVALKTKIQDILSGRSRFVIRKVPVVGTTGRWESSSEDRTSYTKQEKVHDLPSGSRRSEVKRERYCPFSCL